MEDIVQTAGTIAKTAGEIGMTRDSLGKAKDLLQKYGDERDRLFDQMQSLLSKSDADSIIDDWKQCCEKGIGLLEGLNNDMPKSPTGEGLSGVGARDFYEGEKKVWAENGKAQLALVANVIATVKAANAGLVQQCHDVLKAIHDGDTEAQATLNENMDSIKSDLTDVANTLTSKMNDKSLTAWMKEAQAKDYVKKWNEEIIQKTEENFKAAQQKGHSESRSSTRSSFSITLGSNSTRNGSTTCIVPAKTARSLCPVPDKQATTALLIGHDLANRASSPLRKPATPPKSRPRPFSRSFFPPSRRKVTLHLPL